MTRCSACRAARCDGAAWQHDGSAPAKDKLSFGTCFVVAGIIVTLPFCSRPVCLPVLAALHVPGRGKAAGKARKRDPAPASTVSAAAALVTKLARALPGRVVDVVADAHYHGPALRALPAAVTWTTRLPRNAVLYDLAPPPARKPGRRPRKGARLGTPADLAAAAAWTPATVRIYGRDQAEDLAEITCLWYGCLDTITVRVILARGTRATLALVTTDLTAPAAVAGPAVRRPVVHRAGLRRHPQHPGRRRSPHPGPPRRRAAPSRSPCSCTPS